MATFDDVRQLRDRAEECRASAEHYRTPDGREWMLKVATFWDQRAWHAARELAREERRA